MTLFTMWHTTEGGCCRLIRQRLQGASLKQRRLSFNLQAGRNMFGQRSSEPPSVCGFNPCASTGQLSSARFERYSTKDLPSDHMGPAHDSVRLICCKMP